jgi:CheY-like chemotaxis protein
VNFVYQTRHSDCDHLLRAEPVAVSEVKADWTTEAGTTILIVEDDSGTREALCEILDDAGYSVLPAENGMRALESVEETGATPALILLDLAMPVMDGVAFLSQIPGNSRLADVPVIVMSADSRAPQLRAERPDSVMEVLPKPIDVHRMMELVKKHTGPSHGPR